MNSLNNILNEIAERINRIKTNISELKKFVTMYSNYTAINLSSTQKSVRGKRLKILIGNINKEVINLNINLDQINFKFYRKE
jgi:archaellum component FlaC